MGHPTPGQVQVAIEALHDAAAKWRRDAGVLGNAAGAAAGLDLGAFQLSWAGSLTGLVDTYDEIQNKVATLLREGEDNFDRIGDALQTAADGYDRDERDGVHRMRGIW